MATIFWVEDQAHWVEKLLPTLTRTNFDESNESAVTNSVLVYKFVAAAQQAIAQLSEAPDLALLDANMNGNDEAGFSIAQKLREKWPSLPILYLSEHSGTGIEQRAIEQAVAQDFIAKHQHNVAQVLCWRIKAALRQQQVANTAQQPVDTLVCGELTIDLLQWHVYWHGVRLMNPNNPQRPLAPTPRKILKVLVERAPRPVTVTQMAEALALDELSYASYRQHIKTLRHSFEQASCAAKQESFLTLCQREEGLVTVGDLHAYRWQLPTLEPKKG
ncbi:MAG: response regulator transcription factor [Gammaproteobacteria bacterium]|nr:response regulator transcription factor [Gammaproteobacteria bacterium]NVK87114.1 response regulator transcription factor [Gammaproteobacteria bacterium]